MAGLKVTTEPTAEPLSLQEVKEYLRLEDASDERGAEENCAEDHRVTRKRRSQSAASGIWNTDCEL